MQGLTPSTFGMIWLTLVVISFGQVLIKLGLGDSAIPISKNPARMAWNVLLVIFRPKTLAGFSLYVIGTFIWLMVLSRVSLSIAFPLFSMSYFLVVILSATVLHERVQWRYAIVGLVLISIGVSFIGLSSPPKERRVEGGERRVESGERRASLHAEPVEAHAEPVEAHAEPAALHAEPVEAPLNHGTDRDGHGH